MLALGAAKGDDIIIEQANVKNAYLNLWMHHDEVILMDILKFYQLFRQLPEEFKKLLKEGKRVVLRLKWLLYGMKQGAHHWYEELKRILQLLGFKVSITDEATFYKVDGNRFLVIAAVMDDFTIVTNSRKLSTETKAQLNQHFELVDLGGRTRPSPWDSKLTSNTSLLVSDLAMHTPMSHPWNWEQTTTPIHLVSHPRYSLQSRKPPTTR